MSAFELLGFRFLLASAGCVATGLLVWVLAELGRRRLPGLSLRRSVWLLCQLTVAATFLLILLPHSERLRVVPPIDLPETVAQRSPAAPVTHGPAAVAAAVSFSPAGADTDAPARSWWTCAAQAWLVLYLLGLGGMLARLLRARRLLHGLATAGCRLDQHNRHDRLDQHEGLAGLHARGLTPAVDMIEVDAPISPMLFGLFRPRLLLPRHLRRFEASQQQMIIEHELTHLRRRDLYWMSVGIALQTAFWFNPFMWLLRGQLSWAQELGCDRDVMRGRPPTQRKAYAAALVAQLRLHARPAEAAMAFGGVSARTVAARVALIRTPVAARQRWAPWLAATGLAGIVLASLAFQPALARHTALMSKATGPAPENMLARADAAALPAVFGCTVMVDAASGRQLQREGRCDERITPASTFNIAVSLMGYDSGILRDEQTPRLPFRPGYVHWNPSWRAATDPTSWIKNSVVWYAQQVTSRLGAARFQRYVARFNYGNGDVSGDPGANNGLTLSWISSSLKISPLEQVTFLRQIVNRSLPVSARAYDMTARIMPPEMLANGWEVHGKTGTATAALADGSDDAQHQYGWYVGWASKGSRTIVFARMLRDQRQTGYAGARLKEAMLRELTARLDTL
jgi:beta-lactamase class D/beta-lactamase regulating signal transducer with metallopeptidase domain